MKPTMKELKEFKDRRFDVISFDPKTSKRELSYCSANPIQALQEAASKTSQGYIVLVFPAPEDGKINPSFDLKDWLPKA